MARMAAAPRDQHLQATSARAVRRCGAPPWSPSAPGQPDQAGHDQRSRNAEVKLGWACAWTPSAARIRRTPAIAAAHATGSGTGEHPVPADGGAASHRRAPAREWWSGRPTGSAAPAVQPAPHRGVGHAGSVRRPALVQQRCRTTPAADQPDGQHLDAGAGCTAGAADPVGRPDHHSRAGALRWLAGTAIGWYWVFSRYLTRSRWAAAIGGGASDSRRDGVPRTRPPQLHLGVPAPADRGLPDPAGPGGPGTRGALRNGGLLGALVAWQVLIGEEPLLILAIGIAVWDWSGRWYVRGRCSPRPARCWPGSVWRSG